MTNVHISNNAGTADVIAIPSSGPKRKGRGKTTGLSIQKKRKKSDNGKLKVIIPPDRTVAVGPGAKDFVTELSVKVLHNARHDVKNWKGVSDLAKDRIVAHMLDSFQLPDIQHNRDTILQTAKNLYRYRRSRLHDHFKKFATKEARLQNMPEQVDEAEWKFLVEYFSSDDFKKMSERNKSNKAKQEMNHICGRKSFQAVSFEADTVKEVVAEQIQEIEEGTDVDPIVNDAFMQIMREKAGFTRGQGSGIKPANRRFEDEIQEQLEAQQKEIEEDRRKRESLESKLMEIKNQLEEERKNREVMEARLVREQTLLKEGVMALVSHMQSSMSGLPAAVFNIITNSSGSDEGSPTNLIDKNWFSNRDRSPAAYKRKTISLSPSR
ncbi:stress response protein NST1-like isoform X4 [Solanum dulcamara]|uniref:stress response protein NST1-like isoform X4 n=1 Tax=Solanum dulcamara TaxID=45834 RepID=UPI0024869148|nr:stress response protein NST1-like isoform X4 [Solanum dulcamara]